MARRRLAPLPQAAVSPTPRSHTRSWNCPDRNARNSTFVPRGNNECRSTSGPCVATGAVRSSSTNNTQCGLPTSTSVPTTAPTSPAA